MKKCASSYSLKAKLVVKQSICLCREMAVQPRRIDILFHENDSKEELNFLFHIMEQ